MFKLTDQEFARYIDIKWQAELNLSAIADLILFLDVLYPPMPKETWERFVRWCHD